MKNNLSDYALISALFEYPAADYGEKISGVQSRLEGHYPEAAALLRPFTAYMAEAALQVQQELFLRSFDVQAVTTLDLGYVLWGDDYKRGELLVNLNREHREADNDCGVELSDHLPNVLRLLPKLQDAALVAELAQRIVGPALNRMIRGFEPEQVALKDKFYKKQYKTVIERPGEQHGIYQKLLEALYQMLKMDFPVEEKEPTERTSDFLRNINTEATLEG